MNVLLDTHPIIWWLENNPKLSSEYRDIISDDSTLCFISSASIWKIEIKSSIGKLTIPPEYLEELRSEGFEKLPVSWDHCRLLSTLPLIHRDPFDRLLIAQAKWEKLVLLSLDENIRKYDVEVR